MRSRLRTAGMFAAAWLVAALSSAQAPAPAPDLVLRGGRVIDPRNDVDGPRDVAIRGGRIAEVSESVTPRPGESVVDVTGLYVVPGLVDLHAHLFFGTEPDAYLSNGFSAVEPDGFTLRSGVTTAVDLGGAGWRNFRDLHRQVIERSTTRVLAFLNIVGAGMRGGPYEQNLADMDAALTAVMAREFPEAIVGIKVAHYAGPEWDPVDRAVEAGRRAGIPVAVDFGGHEPPLSLEALLLEHLRPGDIFTHTYASVRGRTPIVDDDSELRTYVAAARERGIVFDVGHGGGSFLFSQAVPAIEQGFLPDTISTDLHRGSMNAGMKDLTNVLSKFLAMGMPLADVVAAATSSPARAIGREDLGHLGVGAEADVAVLRLREGSFGFVDTGGYRLDGARKLACELTIRAGRVVWDLNGLSRPAWKR